MKTISALLLVLLAAFPTFGKDKKPAKPLVNVRDVQKITSYWQHVLSLDDWLFHSYMVPVDQLPTNTLDGIRCSQAKRECDLFVLRPDDYILVAAMEQRPRYSKKEMLDDIEVTLIHELVHVRVVEMEMNPDMRTEEMTVLRLTKALVRAKRRLTVPPDVVN